MNSLRVLTVDDEPLALRRLEILLSAIPNVEQVGQAQGVREALKKIDELAPNVVLLDIKIDRKSVV